MLKMVDKRIAQIAKDLAGDKLDIVLLHSEELMATGKKPARALADALEKFKLIKNKPAGYREDEELVEETVE